MDVVEKIIIEWYDGIARALVRTELGENWKYCSLLSLDPGTGKRFYCFVKPDQGSVDKLLEVLLTPPPNAWDEILLREKSLIFPRNCAAEIVYSEQADSLEYFCDVAFEVVRDELGKSLEEATELASIERWSAFSHSDS